MDDPQNLDSQSSKDRPWTTDEIRKHSSNWTLAGDVGLFNLLNEFSHSIISRTHEVENAVDSLVHQTKMTSAKINNVINDFHMLSNLQFVENRVYDEEAQEPVPDTKPIVEKTKEQRETEMLPKIMKAIELGLAVLDTAFDRINVNEISDSEDEEDISSEGRTILEAKDPYEHRPLPYIIGSEQFMKCDFAGLKELVEEDVQSFSEESSLSESDETSSDEGEPLPLDDDKFSQKQADQVSQNISDRFSSSDESELFGSEKRVEANGLESDTSLDFKTKEKNIQRPVADVEPEKKPRQSSVSSMQSRLKLPQVLPVPKLQEKKDEDMFANDEENSDDESPFRKKTGLFASEIRFDEDEKDDLFGGDLFGKSPSKDIKEVKAPEKPKVSTKKLETETISEPKKPALFDNEEDSEDDIFNTLMKTKKPTISKTSNAGSQDSSEKADSLSTPSSAPSIRSSGNAFGFASGTGTGDTLFGDDSDGEDLFATKKSSGRKTFDLGTPDDDDDLFGIISSKPLKETKVTSGTSASLFESNQVSEQPKIESKKSQAIKKKTKDSIFDDSDSSDQEKPVIPAVKSTLSDSAKNKKELSLFDDDDFESDIFTQAKKKSEPTKIKKDESSNLFGDDSKQAKKSELTKKDENSSLFKGESKQVKKSEPTKTKKDESSSLFRDESKQVGSKESKPKVTEKSKNLSIFDDTDEDESSKSKSVEKEVTNSSLFKDDLEKALTKSVPKIEPKKTLPLFEDSGNFDLFTTKPTPKKSEPQISAQVPDADSGISREKDDIDVASSSKVPDTDSGIIRGKDDIDIAVPSKVSPLKDANADSQISFDTPIDNSNVLNVLNKGRAKIATKRRKPTRQGRIAALENSEKEVKSEVEPIATSDPSASDDGSDNLFSVSTTKPTVTPESPKLDYKTQEKKKMNLMSQLMSEVTTKKIGMNKTVVEDEEDEVDIFSEAAKKDRSKSSFSFLPPEQNGIASMFPVDKEDKKEESEVLKSDSFEDDFFTEPAFKNFRSSISSKDPPVLDLGDDEDDDDLFSTIKTNVLPKIKRDAASPSELFDDDDDTDIFANIQKEKYEMFPNQIYEDEDDDIFSNISNPTSNKSSSNLKTNTSSTMKKVETQQVNAFDDPLTGLLGDD